MLCRQISNKIKPILHLSVLVCKEESGTKYSKPLMVKQHQCIFCHCAVLAFYYETDVVQTEMEPLDTQFTSRKAQLLSSLMVNSFYNNDNSRTVNQTNNSPKALVNAALLF